MRPSGFILGVCLLTGCVSNESVQTVQVGDNEKSCDSIRMELAQLGAKFESVKDDSGVTGKNVGLALVFWPGIIVNEVRSNKNEVSVDGRIGHLTEIYNERCSDDENSKSSQSLKEKLMELKTMLDEGLLSEEEHAAAKKKALETN
jgi:outer membrane murein-binding lipoprotein Lpp